MGSYMASTEYIVSDGLQVDASSLKSTIKLNDKTNRTYGANALAFA